MIELGESKPLEITITDDAVPPALVDATNGPTLTLSLPDQTTTSLSPIDHVSTGVYHFDYTTAQAGRHVAKWMGSIGTIPFVHTEVFSVTETDISIVSLAKVKTQIGSTSTINDEELRDYIISATENIEFSCGIFAPRTFTDRLIGTDVFWLTKTPVLSLTSFTPVRSWASPAIAVADVVLNTATGEVSRVDGATFVGEYDIVYKAGRAVIPSSVQDACQIIVQHRVQTRRGPGAVAAGGLEVETLPGWSYAIPRQAAEWLRPFLKGPVFG